MSGKLFYGGVPTRPDVEKLMKFDPKAGTSITYDAIAAEIGVAYGASRFVTVIQAWTKEVFRSRGLQAKREGGAVHFMTADQAHDNCKKGVAKVGRSAGRLRVRTEAVKVTELSSDRLPSHDALRRETQAILEATQKAAKQIAAPKPVTSDRMIA